MSYGIQKIVQRLGRKAEQSLITETYCYLERSKRESGVAQETFVSKERETQALIEYANKNDLWFEDLQFAVYLDEGAEQKVFFNSELGKVTKLNDAIFYVNWSQYFESLIIHNILFKNTEYHFQGFVKINSTLYSVVTQSYIEPSEATNIDDVRNVMIENGFSIKKNNDYIHNKLGLIIEDLHSENVLTLNKELFFIDTVIYLKD